MLDAATLDSVLGREVSGGIALFNKLHERCILQAFYFQPNRAGNRQGKEITDVFAQSVRLLKEARSHCVVSAAQMQDYEDHKSFLLGTHCLVLRVGAGIENARQFRLPVHSFPQITMLLRQFDQIGDAASASLKEKRDADQKQSRKEYAGLNERKPIVTHPVREDHSCIIAVLPKVSYF